MTTFPLARFDLTAQDGEARCGTLHLSHGSVDTPIFMPVGTLGTVKGLTPANLRACGASMVLANAYHLYLQPGLEVLEAHGGLHDMMAWKRPILTDSGGYQVFSLKELREITEDGVDFQDHRTGDRHLFTPELVIRIQETIGSDIMMAFDECPSLPADNTYLQESLARTTRWARRCLAARRRKDCCLFGITQGGTDLALRRQHIEELCGLPFDGFAIGGLSVGEAKPAMYDTVQAVAPQLPVARPRYLMGVGTPKDLMECVRRGVDMFDCVMPTRNARNGQLFTSKGKIIIKHARYKLDTSPPDPDCTCYTCCNFSRAYLRHIFKNREMLAGHLMTLHNVHYYQDLMRGLRRAILMQEIDAFIAQRTAAWEESP